jgi:hypothetical protein
VTPGDAAREIRDRATYALSGQDYEVDGVDRYAPIPPEIVASLALVAAGTVWAVWRFVRWVGR